MKVLIGIITYEADWYCLEEFSKAINKLKNNGFQTEIYIVDNSDTQTYCVQLKKMFPTAKIVYYEPPNLKGLDKFRHCELECRKIVRQYALENDFDYLFFVDSDVIVPENALNKLLSREKKIICGRFWYRPPPEGRTLWFKKIKPEQISENTGVWLIDFISNDFYDDFTASFPGQVMGIDACGFGAVLIHKEPLNKIQFKKSPNNHYGADIHFCYDAKKLGYKIYGDPEVFCDHKYELCDRRAEGGNRPSADID
jgi:GT2 family glycosyltransferase